MCPDHPSRAERRGVLLLLVLSVLTLFLLMGAMLLTVATRARTAARGFAAATDDFEASPALPRSLLDEALLILIRGSRDQNVRARVTESLLGDMYEQDGNTVPFRTEVFDAFQSGNAFLTQTDDNGAVTKAAFGVGPPADNGAEKAPDNDADGQPDGVWLQNVLPPLTSPRGGTLSFRVSYLVLDLDGRINVNTHGDPAPLAPVGPASIDASSLPPFADGRWTLLHNGGQPTPPADNPNSRRRPPVIGKSVSGRGGSAADLRLDREASRPATLAGLATQNPFTPGELERVLRPFDADWATLPPRLAALLVDLDGSARRLVTTDSWDVTWKVGPAAPAAGGTPERRFDLTSIPGSKAGFATALFNAISPAALAGNNLATAQWVANVTEFRAALSGDASAPLPLTIGGHTVTGIRPADLGAAGAAWTGTGGFLSSGELAGIPRGSKAEIDAILAALVPVPLVSLVTSHPAILEAVMVPSRFTATIAVNGDREPGRVNLNTCSDATWGVVCGPSFPARPAGRLERLWDALALAFRLTPAGGPYPAHDVRTFDRDLANRLAAVTTVRSHVFAVWITLEVSDSSPTADSPSCHRLFAIVDRSIPVEYFQGENRNVRQTIRVKRFLD